MAHIQEVTNKLMQNVADAQKLTLSARAWRDGTSAITSTDGPARHRRKLRGVGGQSTEVRFEGETADQKSAFVLAVTLTFDLLNETCLSLSLTACIKVAIWINSHKPVVRYRANKPLSRTDVCRVIHACTHTGRKQNSSGC